MKLIKTKDYQEMSKKAAEIVVNEIRKNPKIVIGFASGKTAVGLYNELVKAFKRKKVDFSKIKTFNLDEYWPIKRFDKESFHHYMFKNLFNKVNVKKENVNILNGEAIDYKLESKDYEDKIKKNPIGLQILGLGVNGHIGFNEPGSKPSSKTRLIELTKETKKINKTNKKALTMGISTIMKAKKLVLLASGESKEEAIMQLVRGKISSKWPVSFLRKHKNLIVIIDKQAGSLI